MCAFVMCIRICIIEIWERQCRKIEKNISNFLGFLIFLKGKIKATVETAGNAATRILNNNFFVFIFVLY